MSQSLRVPESEKLHGGYPSDWRRGLELIRRLREADYWTYGKPHTMGPGPFAEVDGRRMLNFVSNDYLGLSRHPEVVEAAVRAGRQHGASTTGSSTVCGLTPLHEKLEARLAEWTGQEDALLFPSGYQGNLSVVSTLVGEGDDVVIDRLDHASIIDGARFSGANVRVFRHNDIPRLERQLERASGRRRLVVVESVYSVDGDEADLAAVCTLAERHHALVMVDEAHSIGCQPPAGAGAVVASGVDERVGLIYGSLGKCLGAQGCFISGSRDAIDYLQNHSRGYIFSTALSPMLVGAALAAVDLIQREPERIDHLRKITERFHTELRRFGFDVGRTSTPITPILSPHRDPRSPMPILRLGMALRERGVCSLIVSQPTVPLSGTRLRMNVRGDMSEEDIDRALDAIRAAARETDFFG